MELVANIYRLSRTFPEEERFGLSNQIQRAVISIPSNIAEGMGRFSNISQQQFDEQELFISETTKMLVGLRQNFEDKLV
jgi:hypothetical protein